MNLDTNYVTSMRNRTVRLDRKGDYWTEEERENLKLDFACGAGITEMAIKFQRTEPAIIQQIEKMDLYNRKNAPSRRKSAPKEAVCLCSMCVMDPSRCPMKATCPRLKEEN